MDYQTFKKNAELYPGPIEVTWVDSLRDNEWVFLDSIKQPEEFRVISVGWAIAGNDRVLLLASSQSVITPAHKKTQVLGTLDIPVVAIVDIVPLYPPQVSDTAMSEGPRPLVTEPPRSVPPHPDSLPTPFPSVIR